MNTRVLHHHAKFAEGPARPDQLNARIVGQSMIFGIYQEKKQFL